MLFAFHTVSLTLAADATLKCGCRARSMASIKNGQVVSINTAESQDTSADVVRELRNLPNKKIGRSDPAGAPMCALIALRTWLERRRTARRLCYRSGITKVKLVSSGVEVTVNTPSCAFAI